MAQTAMVQMKINNLKSEINNDEYLFFVKGIHICTLNLKELEKTDGDFGIVFEPRSKKVIELGTYLNEVSNYYGISIEELCQILHHYILAQKIGNNFIVYNYTA